MKVHHLELCTMCPVGGRLVSGRAGVPAELVVHALLVETADGLVLVDTGFGLDDVRDARARLGSALVTSGRPDLREEKTAARQVERLGFHRADVRHIVVTHLDPDHAGGLPDFPHAEVHVHRVEHDAAMRRATFAERRRYRPAHLAHGPRWALHEHGGDAWFGFDSVRVVAGDVLLVPLFGHSRGHSGVAVRAPDPSGDTKREWLLLAGDAYFAATELDDPPSCPPALAAFQRLVAIDERARRANQARLRELHREHGATVRIFSAHAASEYRALAGATRA